MKRIIIYHFRGLFERGPRYTWCKGYSADHPEGGVIYPWRTRQECREEARKWGAQAVFCTCGLGFPPKPCIQPSPNEEVVPWGGVPANKELSDEQP